MEHDILVLKRSKLLQLQYIGLSHMCRKFDVSHMHPTLWTHRDQFSIMCTVSLTCRGHTGLGSMSHVK